MKKTILNYTILFIIILAVCTTLFYLKNNKKDLDLHITNIVENTKVIDKNIDHNQALDVIEYAQKQRIKPPSILINFDTHSDMYLNQKISPTEGAKIEDWINEYIAKNDNVDTVYWVMPKEEALDFKLRFIFGFNDEAALLSGTPLYGNTLKLFMPRFLFIPLNLKAYKQNALIDPKTAILNEYVKNYKYNKILFDKNTKYRKVTIINCTENTLPDFKDKDVFLSIDADYLSNLGFDTTEDFQIQKTSQEVYETFHSMMNTLDKKHVRPSVISMTLSPQYLPAQHHEQVQDLFEQVLNIAKKPDALSSYTRFRIINNKN